MSDPRGRTTIFPAYDCDSGFGVSNWGRFSNQELNRLFTVTLIVSAVSLAATITAVGMFW